ncbi:hypothetical protein ECL_01669 [Enterobacter cloacae subsp. cloacae ATCC 13047]|uniref:Uncharacterized protein n=1 Tax=Enterobacter cloacae subsp. cloacae (strain ATCC 13047 / DSM 30054 / NBRC 13535 / NCTC 10005 / WDCM 00083 / NCDC 279-56) TaxID=716541 RepID=A0A0H3CJA1_ENTCC|nr:hypothetical protein ECL_01669 [Enterobacter cloacae subsp. cloacae ATCC 13047]
MVWLALPAAYSTSDIRGSTFNITSAGGEEVYLMELLSGGRLAGGFYRAGGADCEKN